MRGAWVVLSLMIGAACSNGGTGSGALPEAADFLPMVDTVSSDGEQPRLLLRCEEGRVDAYLVVGTPDEVESGEADARAVPVKLDSVPSC